MEPWLQVLFFLFGLMLTLLFAGVPVAAALALAAIVSSYTFLGTSGILKYVAWSATSNFILTAIPLFILMGEVVLQSGLASHLYDGVSTWVRKIPGGLLHSNIVSCSIFAAISGSSVATAATIGTVAIPEEEKRGYEYSIVVGSLAAGGTLGILIPPSIDMIIYGAMTSTSVGQLFIAGIFPGIMVASLFMLYMGIRARLQPKIAPTDTSKRLSSREILTSFKQVWPVLLLMSIIMVGIYLGIMTPTEAAAVSAVTALIIALSLRLLTWQKFKNILFRAIRLNAMLVFIFIGAQMASATLAALHVAEELSSFIVSLGWPRLAVLVSIYGMYFALGCVLDALAMLLITLPIVFPVIVNLGYDPVWFAVALVIMIEVAMITPPVGMNLYVIHGLNPEHHISEVIKGAVPFFLILLVAVAIITMFPEIALFLPSTMK